MKSGIQECSSTTSIPASVLQDLPLWKSWTWEELAGALEVSRQTIGSLENGRYNPSIILAFRIARYFDMSIEEIFIYEEEEK